MDLTRRSFVGSLPGLLALTTVPEGTVVGRASQGTFTQNVPTWRELDGKLYGAKPDERGPIGGGSGYTNLLAGGDYEAKTLDELIDALSKVKAGQVIFIPGETEIDLTTRIYIEELELTVPEGVTIAGERGRNGSKGAILTSDALKTPVIFKIAGPNVRISGLRIQGPNPKRYEEHHTRSFGKEGLGREYYYKFPTSMGIHTEFSGLRVDNCEISAFTRGVFLASGKGHHVHHNFIHHCQYKGLGYGVTHGVASSLIEYNLFDSNRHSLAGTGSPGCGYTARHNVELGTSLSHCFDMHGGRDRKDGTTIAGTFIEIYNNTFRSTERAVGIRGVPEDKCVVHNNWITEHNSAKTAVLSEGKTVIFNNIYGTHPVKPE